MDGGGGCGWHLFLLSLKFSFKLHVYFFVDVLKTLLEMVVPLRKKLEVKGVRCLRGQMSTGLARSVGDRVSGIISYPPPAFFRTEVAHAVNPLRLDWKHKIITRRESTHGSNT